MNGTADTHDNFTELASIFDHYEIFAEIDGISKFVDGKFYISDMFKSDEEYEAHRSGLISSGVKLPVWFLQCTTSEHFFANVIKINSELNGIEQSGRMEEFLEAAGVKTAKAEIA